MNKDDAEKTIHAVVQEKLIDNVQVPESQLHVRVKKLRGRLCLFK